MDFSKAYYTVWREKLLLNMLDASIPSTFIRWLQFFLSSRRARVQFSNVFSSSRHFTQGLPQGSVFASLLFLFYIKNLASSLTNDAVMALLGDDVSILIACKREDAKATVQSVINSVFD